MMRSTTRISDRPTIEISDFKLRIFVDTNILIDYVEKFDKNQAVTFLNLFRNEDFADVELVSTDYVLWEFYGQRKEELYINKMVEDQSYGFRRAHRKSKRFEELKVKDMEDLGNLIKSSIEQIRDIVTIEKLADRSVLGFGQTMERLLQCSKFSPKDTIIFVSALFTRSDMILTLDNTFSKEGHLHELRTALKSLHATLPRVEFRLPKNLSTVEGVKKEYKRWFEKNNQQKVVGKVIKHWQRKNVVAVKCTNGFVVGRGDFLYLVKFFDLEIHKFSFKIKGQNLRDYVTKKSIQEGNNVTVKLPSNLPYKTRNWKNGDIFLSES